MCEREIFQEWVAPFRFDDTTLVDGSSESDEPWLPAASAFLGRSASQSSQKVFASKPPRGEEHLEISLR